MEREREREGEGGRGREREGEREEAARRERKHAAKENTDDIYMIDVCCGLSGSPALRC